ncbi:hypothetical protein E2R51_09070 [Jeotgalibacillus sp. S-D1]|uniref:hypothetical protein n=1 Tax=Jeotgalibacillus sp. S-D1 TaxID=2552189 RepID=UPI00105A78E2|nr:hypothetical protein [Jeotgalibacillus sp. S-D1]TDL32811.1 hypothetical protein E2R51_09070 [Jeotgalibacillus sp. S-D1]
MEYVKPVVNVEEMTTVNEAITWTIVALAAIVAAGGYAAWCTANGANFAGSYDQGNGQVSIGCVYP